MANDAIHYLEERLNEAAQSLKGGAVGGEVSTSNDEYIDTELSLDAVNWQLADELGKLAPFGIGNEKPVFLFRNVSPATVKSFGKTGDHIELGFKKSNGSALPAIAFFAGTTEWAKRVKPNQPVDLVASVEKSMFRGRPELRLRVVDVM